MQGKCKKTILNWSKHKKVISQSKNNNIFLGLILEKITRNNIMIMTKNKWHLWPKNMDINIV